MPELTWILFLRILDEREQQEAEYAEAVGAQFTPPFQAPHRIGLANLVLHGVDEPHL